MCPLKNTSIYFAIYYHVVPLILIMIRTWESLPSKELLLLLPFAKNTENNSGGVWSCQDYYGNNTFIWFFSTDNSPYLSIQNVKYHVFAMLFIFRTALCLKWMFFLS
jgi:hypothetical protein